MKKSAFTLVEVLVAIAILSFGALGVTSLFRSDASLERKAFLKMKAFNILENRAEDLLASPLGAPPQSGEEEIEVDRFKFILQTIVAQDENAESNDDPFAADDFKASVKKHFLEPTEILLKLKTEQGQVVGTLNLAIGGYLVQ